MTLMRVRALTPDPAGQTATLVLEDPVRERALGFVVPMNEAIRLDRLLRRRCCAAIFNLTLRLVAQMRAHVSRTVLDAEEEGITAALVLDHEGNEVWLPCHPADAVALAAIAEAPIYASGAAMDHACPLRRCAAHGIDAVDAARWLDGVRPDDFAAGADEDR